MTDRVVRRLFLIYFVAFLANQMSRPFLPVVIEGVVGTGPGLASSIGLVTGIAALIGALSSPIGGMGGDRFGFRNVLVVGLGGGALALALLPWLPSLPLLALAALVFVAFNGIIGPMVFSMLATDVPAERRSATLNLVYLPLYAAGIVGPTTGAVTAGAFGVPGPFMLAAAILGLSATLILASRRR
jgi:DHA1 family multidrug resistance protein-like MFS transporter